MIDAHIHLDQYPKEEIDRLVDDWHRHGITSVVAVSMNLSSAYRTLELKERFPDFVHAAIGYHPEQSLPSSTERDELLQLIACERDRITAIGEVGLPHYRVGELGIASLQPYIELLETFADTAKRYGLPIVLHAVHDKAELALAVCTRHRLRNVHFHWLKAPDQVVTAIVQQGYFISLTPEVCYRERDQNLLRMIPRGQLLLETDGPWPFDGPFTDQATTPLLLARSLEAVSRLTNESSKRVASQTIENTQRCYLLP